MSSTATAAIIQNGVVTNTIIVNVNDVGTPTGFTPPPGSDLAVIPEGSPAAIGWAALETNGAWGFYQTLTPTVTTTLAAATESTAYSATLTATGGSGSFTWTATDLPAWLTLSGDTLSGTAPTDVESDTLTVTVTDTITGQTTSQELTVNVEVAS